MGGRTSDDTGHIGDAVMDDALFNKGRPVMPGTIADSLSSVHSSSV